MTITEKQITQEIEGRLDLTVHFADGIVETVQIFEQDGHRWLRPLFCAPHHITDREYRLITADMKPVKGGTVHDYQTVTDLKYDEFFDRFYNGR